MKKHVIIGAGISGMSLAYHLKKLNKKDEIVIIDKDYTQGTSYHSNNLYFTSSEKNKKFSLSIEKLSPIFLIHFLCIQIIFFFYIRNINEYFSKFNFFPLPKKKCNNIQYYDLQKYRDFVDSIKIIKDEYLFLNEQKNNTLYVKCKNKDYICDYLYDCTASCLNKNFLIKVSSDSIYVKVDKMNIKCLIREDIYWIMPLNQDTIKISMHLYMNYSTQKKNNKIDLNKISEIFQKYNMKIIKIKDEWYGSRTCSYDLLPFYYEKEKNVFVITGGSFLGFNTLPAISREIAHKVNGKKIKKYKYDLSINRIYKEMFIVYTIITLFILFFIRRYYKK